MYYRQTDSLRGVGVIFQRGLAFGDWGSRWTLPRRYLCLVTSWLVGDCDCCLRLLATDWAASHRTARPPPSPPPPPALPGLDLFHNDTPLLQGISHPLTLCRLFEASYGENGIYSRDASYCVFLQILVRYSPYLSINNSTYRRNITEIRIYKFNNNWNTAI